MEVCDVGSWSARKAAAVRYVPKEANRESVAVILSFILFGQSVFNLVQRSN
jgi:hypothetical protein